jgi:hypothetical protein
VVGGGRSGDDENSGADNLADAEHDQACGPERTMKLVLMGNDRIGLDEFCLVACGHAVIPPVV